MIELLERNKENLLTELAASKAADKAVRILENELDRLLLTYNEQCADDRQRSAAANLLQAIRLSLPLIDSAGETKIWETETEHGSKGRISPLLFLFLIAALVLCGLGLLPFLLPQWEAGKSPELIKPLSLLLGGLVCAALGGTFCRRIGSTQPRYRRQVEVRTDPGKIYRTFRNAILAADQSLEEIRAMDRWDKRDQAGSIDGRPVSPAQLELFSDLLEAEYLQDPEFALEKISQIRYYLHSQQIEAVDYTEDTQPFFNMMPGQTARTIRPALVADGKLLCRGIASSGAK
ncbi:MAG: hypothetical protein IJ109_06710 [Firmicutes bacterium]|nr:hypothetical protein [Bacillota bacterium]